MKTDNKKVIITKQSLYWHFIESYLEGLGMLNVYADEELYRLYLQMRDYVGSKLEFYGKGDVIEQYVVTEQEPIDEQEYQDWLKRMK